MIRTLTSAAVPLFLLLCLLLGGSSQSIFGLAALQLMAVLLLLFSYAVREEGRRPRGARLLLLLMAAMVAVTVAQVIPLPPALWKALPGHELIASGQQLLGYPDAWMSWSLAPFDTLATAYWLLIPIAVAAAILALPEVRSAWIAGAVVLGALASILLGAVQLAGGPQSWAYLYDYTNTGAVGVFANRNHMASLLVAAIPFAAALFVTGRLKVRGRGSNAAALLMGGIGFALIIVGLFLNASLAALALSVPVTILSALLLPVGWKFRGALVPIGILALLGALFLLTDSNVRSDLVGSSGAFISRGEMWKPTIAAIGEYFPAGSGVGTFPQVFALHEPVGQVGQTYVNHAHNDYLELLLETGLAGLLLVLAALAWWLWQCFRVWRSPLSSHVAKAATIASAAILAHSAVDYPARTAAVAAVLAASAALMARGSARASKDDPRHVRIG